MAAPADSVVKLYVDLREAVAPGHVIETGTTGRRYERGAHKGRQHLRRIWWYRRERRRSI